MKVEDSCLAITMTLHESSIFCVLLACVARALQRETIKMDGIMIGVESVKYGSGSQWLACRLMVIILGIIAGGRATADEIKAPGLAKESGVAQWVALWNETAQELAVTPGAREQTSAILNSTLPRCSEMAIGSVEDRRELKKSLKRFVKNHFSLFENPHECQGAASFLAFCIYKARLRASDPGSSSSTERLGLGYQRMLEGLKPQIAEGFKKAVAKEDYEKLSPHLEAIEQRWVDNVMASIRTCQADPLCPAYRSEITTSAQEAIAKMIKDVKGYPRLEEPQEMMIYKSERDDRRVDSFFKSLHLNIAYEIFYFEIEDPLRCNPMWSSARVFSVVNQAFMAPNSEAWPGIFNINPFLNNR